MQECTQIYWIIYNGFKYIECNSFASIYENTLVLSIP